jgi:hypothetical protein
MARATAINGKNAKVTLGANKVLGIGEWKYTAPQAEQLEQSEFEDQVATYDLGIKKGGQITFSGLADITDTTGQDVLLLAHHQGTRVTNIRFYFNQTNYLIPNSTAGYFDSGHTTGYNTPVSSVLISSYNIGQAKNGFAPIDFSCLVDGLLVRV